MQIRNYFDEKFLNHLSDHYIRKNYSALGRQFVDLSKVVPILGASGLKLLMKCERKTTFPLLHYCFHFR
jgi:hypothetical protein